MRPLFFVSLLVLTACGPTQSTSSSIDDGLATPRPYGLFDDGSAGYFDSISINTDHTYDWSSDVDSAEGALKFSAADEHDYLLLYETDNGKTATTATTRYEYEWHPEKAALLLRQAPGGTDRNVGYSDWWTMHLVGQEGDICIPSSFAHVDCSVGLSCLASPPEKTLHCIVTP